MKQLKSLKLIPIFLLLIFILAGCKKTALPPEEQTSIAEKKDTIDELFERLLLEEAERLAKQSREFVIEETIFIPEFIRETREAREVLQNVTVIAGLVHPLRAKNPYLVTINGQYFEIIENYTDHDIITIKQDVEYLMATLNIGQKKDQFVTYAELADVIYVGDIYSGPLGKLNGQYTFRYKEVRYLIEENHTGVDLETFMGQNNFYFGEPIGKLDNMVKLALYVIY